MRARELKQKIKKKELTIGYQQFLNSPEATEIAGFAGFDWSWLCIEHGTTGFGAELENCIRAAEYAGMVPMVRIADPHSHFMYMRIFEAGAKGVIVPRVKTKEDVVRAVEQVRFPPHGIHGFCPGSRRWQYECTSTKVDLNTTSFPEEDAYGYLTYAEEELFVVPIIETKEAVDNLDEILSVEGIDFVSWGFGDLAVSLGLRGRGAAAWEKGKQVIENIRQQVVKACKKSGVPVAQVVFPNNAETAKKLIDEGCFLLVTPPDVALLSTACKTFVKATKGDK